MKNRSGHAPTPGESTPAAPDHKHYSTSKYPAQISNLSGSCQPTVGISKPHRPWSGTSYQTGETFRLSALRALVSGVTGPRSAGRLSNTSPDTFLSLCRSSAMATLSIFRGFSPARHRATYCSRKETPFAFVTRNRAIRSTPRVLQAIGRDDNRAEKR